MMQSEEKQAVSPADRQIADRARTVLELRVRPYIQAHGGDAELVGVENGTVEIRMSAACGACELKPVTFASRIRAELLGVPGVEEVVCGAVPYGPKQLDKIAAFFG